MENAENEKLDYQRLKRYLQDREVNSDESEIEKYFSRREGETELYRNSLQFWNEIKEIPFINELDEESRLSEIHQKINLSGFHSHKRDYRQPKWRKVLGRAVAILLIPVLFIAGYLFNNAQQSSTSPAHSEIYAPLGTRTRFILPDGSTGFLNGGSKITFNTRFTGKTRNVELTGEAYFDIIKDVKKPFIVSTADINVKVLGTQFNVSAYPDEFITEVTLEKGQVVLFKKDNNKLTKIATLKPSQTCIYDRQLNTKIIKNIETNVKTAWKDGKLIFKYEPFNDVIRKINRWYNVNIIIKDKTLESYNYYGTFLDETLDEVLKLLKRTAPIQYKFIERKARPDGTFEHRQIEIYSSKSR
jgi:transmembrane sensor